ncbi:Ppx/GppA phosphatase family protein [Caulobacter sp. 17J65-9]|uniref:Ppx/GppA phosphatase family protein n=1 Tax=Caulobacter sp. 17J65-9 TaxID=2709382 RepID=UPI0013CB791C|nr:Ppx/GppA phosphatase family protein [Caulobacter sp. 17J65-9]NEX91334.1 Ppx/GppA family phosphatase [Caulobacter sp. 17J65-9]
MPHADRPGRDAAVVDVGSNSVRLVIYRLEGRAIWTVFNEKVLAGLGRGVEATGRLSPDGVRDAMAALRRFKAVIDASRPEEIHTAATAAVRDAEDGPEFIERVRREIGLDIRVLSGPEEARYAALGVVAGSAEAEGVVGDLGGSSLELTRVDHGDLSAGITLPLGPFALGAPKGFDADVVRRTAVERLKGANADFKGRTFHAVGGAWRNLALIHMRMTDYPLQIVHQYEIPARDASALARLIAKQSKSSLERIPGIAKKRLDTLPYSAVVLDALVDRLGFERVVFSAYGVREGMLFEAMPPEVRRLDPLVEGCFAIGARQGASEGLGQALAAWLHPLFDDLEPVFGDGRDRIVVESAARLADIGARLHPDHRADLAFTQVLRAPVGGQSHPERAFLATSVFARYGGSGATPEQDAINRLLYDERVDRARALGLALRLGCDLSARSPALLARSAVSLQSDGRLCLTARADSADMLLGEQTAKRAQALATALGVELVMKPA